MMKYEWKSTSANAFLKFAMQFTKCIDIKHNDWSIVSFIHLVNTTWLSFLFYSIKTFMTQVNSNSYLRHFSNVRNAVFAEYIISMARKALLFFAIKFSNDLTLFCGTLMSIINVDIHVFFFWIVKTWKIRCADLYGIPINNLLGDILKSRISVEL